MKVIVANAFSLNMLPFDEDKVLVVEIEKLDNKGVLETLALADEIESAIGHEATAKLFNELFGTDLRKNRIAITLDKDVQLLVIQLRERIPEGKVLSLPEIREMLDKGKIAFFRVQILL